ncbi:MAG TPA: pyridoxal phosphate-dependent aminotransferase family protein [Kiloniellaceae bacterium]|nr:pyridoxal phosphate-dependent aminotransferase family protein [Kiloniellaceae bacterium]
MDILDKYDGIAERHDQLLAKGADPFNVCMDRIVSATEAIVDGKPVILFGTNNYLGLTFDPDCIEAAADSIRSQGTGTTGSRIANGTYGSHKALEAEMAAFFEKDHTMIFPTGYQANLGAIAGVAGPRDLIFLDADSHSSIYDGCRLSGADLVRFRHNDPADLDRRLARAKDSSQQKVVVLESIYSMFGDCAPLADFIAVKEKHGATVILDEAHSVGVFGAKGQGLAYELGILDKVDFIVGTFSKSLGAVGGFCASSHPGFETLRFTARQYMFTASSSPSSVASVRCALAKMAAHPELRQRLWQNAKDIHDAFHAMGLQVCADASPIIAVRLPDEITAVTMWNALLQNGVYVNLALPPGTPDKTCLLRCSVSAAHRPEQVEQICATFAAVIEQIGLPVKRPAGDPVDVAALG